MKLHLSSYYLGNRPEELAGLVGANKKAGIIMNAGDIYGDAKRPAYLADEVEKLKALGLSAEELDLRDYFSGSDSSILRTKLESYGLVWVMGGNSFVLRTAMKMSGFDQIVKELVNSDRLVYGGFSAGSVVATRTLKGIELVDDPAQIPPGYDREMTWDGLGFVDFSIAPHYQSDHPESAAIEKVVRYFKDRQMPYKALHDGEALVVNGTDVRLVR